MCVRKNNKDESFKHYQKLGKSEGHRNEHESMYAMHVYSHAQFECRSLNKKLLLSIKDLVQV